MARYVKFLTGNNGWIRNKMGTGHSALDCDSGGLPIYITWNGRIPHYEGISGAARKQFHSNFKAMEANRCVGFESIRSPGGATIANPLSWDGLQAPTEQSDYRNLPHSSIEIPVRAPAGITTQREENLFGIDVDLMSRWFVNILRLPPESPQRSYKFLATMNSNATNCNGMVGRALQIGLLDAYAPAPKNLLYQGNATLTRWVIEANKKIRFLNEGRSKIMMLRQYIDAQPFPWGDQQEDFNGVCDLPPMNDWMRHSAVKSTMMTGMARRKEQILEIDRLIPLYHTARQRYKSLQNVNNSPVTQNIDDANAEWMKLLISIYEQCFSHLTYKPTSDRRQAVLSLTKNIHNILEGRSHYITKLVNGAQP